MHIIIIITFYAHYLGIIVVIILVYCSKNCNVLNIKKYHYFVVIFSTHIILNNNKKQSEFFLYFKELDVHVLYSSYLFITMNNCIVFFLE